MTETKNYLALGSIVVIHGAIKKLMIVSRGNVLENRYFDYGAIMYPEGMVDENVAYFNQEDILKVVHEGYKDDDDALLLQELERANEKFEAMKRARPETVEVKAENTAAHEEDPFASVRDLED